MADEAAPVTDTLAEAAGDTILTGADVAVEEPKVEGDPKPEDKVEIEGEKPEYKADSEAKEGDDAGDDVPEDYADFAVEEGFELNPETLGAFKELAKTDKLSQEKAQGYVDLAAKLVKQNNDALADQILEVRKSWIKAANEDPEFGGEKFDESIALARRGLEASASPELRKLLDETGLGNNPEVIRHFIGVGKMTAEDKVVAGGTAPAQAEAMAKRMYPSMK